MHMLRAASSYQFGYKQRGGANWKWHRCGAFS